MPDTDLRTLAAEALLGRLRLLLERGQPLSIITAGLEMEGLLASLDEAHGRLEIHLSSSASQPIPVGGKVQLAFASEGQRWVGASKVLLRHDRIRYGLELPASMTRVERRSSVRVSLDPLSGLRALLKLSRDGPALTGPLLDLSRGGFCMHLERAFDLDTRQRLDPATLDLSRGQEVHSLEVTGLREESLDAAGILCDLDRVPDGYQLRVQFRGLLRADKAFLDLWSQSSRGSELALLPLPSRPPDPPAAPPARQAALLRLKKKLRSILVVMRDGGLREKVLRFLREDGYGRVLGAESLLEVAALFQGAPIHLALVDGDLPEARDLDLLRFLGTVRDEQPCPILLAVPGGIPGLEAEALAHGADGVLPRPYLGPSLAAGCEHWLRLREAPAPDRGDQALKAFKTLGLVAPPGPALDALRATLGGAGYRHLVPLGTLEEVALAPAVDLLVVDWPGPEAPLGGILRLLQAQAPRSIAVVADAPSEALTRLCRELGDARLLGRSGLAEALLALLSGG
jgi:CheY-like chemotaxis protein